MVFYYCFACKERSRLFDLFKAFDKIGFFFEKTC